MTREKAIRILSMIQLPQCGDEEITEDERYIALDMAIQALENHDTFMKYAYSQGKQDALSQEPCEDAISRDAVKELIKSGVSTDTYDDVEQVCKWIDEMPSFTQKSGKWINDECGNVICSECKRFRRDCRFGHTNYCNHCGAKMFEPQASEEISERNMKMWEEIFKAERR